MEPRTDPGDELSPARFTHRELAQISTGLWAALSEEIAAIPRSLPFRVEALAARYRMVAERMGDTPDPVVLAAADRIITEAGQS